MCGVGTRTVQNMSTADDGLFRGLLSGACRSIAAAVLTHDILFSQAPRGRAYDVSCKPCLPSRFF
jgi:hypothetical protein